MKRRILHTESSNGWGGQEIRILKEAKGMRQRGHEILFAVVKGGMLASRAREAGFTVYECDFRKIAFYRTIPFLSNLIKKEGIDLVNTHSSSDAWLGGIAARSAGKRVIRTRHLSTSIRKGLNSRLLYNGLADFVVTTSSAIIPVISAQAHISLERCRCIPTGITPLELIPSEVADFRRKWGIGAEHYLIGTACVVRSWKGIKEFMRAAELLRKIHPYFRWIVVGGGYIDHYRDEIDLEGALIFTGHLENPEIALGAMDLFLLLSTAHEGISQSLLQAAYLERPCITTTVGGLPEVCIHGKTGLQVPPFSPEAVAEAIVKLSSDPHLSSQLGKAARHHVETHFTEKQMLDEMERVYHFIQASNRHTV